MPGSWRDQYGPEPGEACQYDGCEDLAVASRRLETQDGTFYCVLCARHDEYVIPTSQRDPARLRILDSASADDRTRVRSW